MGKNLNPPVEMRIILCSNTFFYFTNVKNILFLMSYSSFSLFFTWENVYYDPKVTSVQY